MTPGTPVTPITSGAPMRRAYVRVVVIWVVVLIGLYVFQEYFS